MTVEKLVAQAAALGAAAGAGQTDAPAVQPGVESAISQGWNDSSVPLELFQV